MVSIPWLIFHTQMGSFHVLLNAVYSLNIYMSKKKKGHCDVYNINFDYLSKKNVGCFNTSAP